MSKLTYEELLKQRDELLEALKEADIFMRAMKKLHPENMTEIALSQIEQVQQAIKSAEAL